jgi:hypothetical protein
MAVPWNSSMAINTAHAGILQSLNYLQQQELVPPQQSMASSTNSCMTDEKLERVLDIGICLPRGAGVDHRNHAGPGREGCGVQKNLQKHHLDYPQLAA